MTWQYEVQFYPPEHDYEGVLSIMGNQGWELCTITESWKSLPGNRRQKGFLYYFKRPSDWGMRVPEQSAKSNPYAPESMPGPYE